MFHKISVLFFYRVLRILFVCSILSACSQRSERPLTSLQQQFRRQIQKSCNVTGVQYQKSAVNLNDTLQQREVQVFSLDSISIQNDTCILFNELKYAMETVYDDPRLSEIFTIEKVGDTAIARVKPENAASSDLRLQKVLKDANENILYIETKLVQDSWLYDTQIDIIVYFDSTGVYQHHTIDSKMEVSTISEAFFAQIEGQLISHD